MGTHTCACVYIHVYKRIHMYTHTYMHEYVHMHIYTHTCTCTCIWAYTHLGHKVRMGEAGRNNREKKICQGGPGCAFVCGGGGVEGQQVVV